MGSAPSRVVSGGTFVTVGVEPSAVPTCTEADCEERATFELHLPWAENRVVCAGHARVLGRQDGVVADPLPEADDELP